MSATAILPEAAFQKIPLCSALVRICSWCEKMLDPTCPNCKSKSVTRGEIGDCNLASCGDCGHIFPTTTHGLTHGICAPCRHKFFSESHGSIVLP